MTGFQFISLAKWGYKPTNIIPSGKRLHNCA